MYVPDDRLSYLTEPEEPEHSTKVGNLLTAMPSCYEHKWQVLRLTLVMLWNMAFPGMHYGGIPELWLLVVIKMTLQIPCDCPVVLSLNMAYILY